jgi:hypothetical protein
MFESGLRFAVERTRKPPLYAESKSGLKDAINAARYDR